MQHLVALHGCPEPDSSRRGKPANSPPFLDDTTNQMNDDESAVADEAAATDIGAAFFEAAAQTAMNAANVITG